MTTTTTTPTIAIGGCTSALQADQFTYQWGSRSAWRTDSLRNKWTPGILRFVIAAVGTVRPTFVATQDGFGHVGYLHSIGHTGGPMGGPGLVVESADRTHRTVYDVRNIGVILPMPLEGDGYYGPEHDVHKAIREAMERERVTARFREALADDQGRQPYGALHFGPTETGWRCEYRPQMDAERLATLQASGCGNYAKYYARPETILTITGNAAPVETFKATSIRVER